MGKPDKDKPDKDKPKKDKQGKNQNAWLSDFWQNWMNKGRKFYEDQAQAQVDWMLSPQYSAISQAELAARQDYDRNAALGQSIYGGLMNTLNEINAAGGPQLDAIQQGLSDQYRTLGSYMPQGGYAPEAAGFQNMFGAAGAGGLGLLSSQEAQNALYNQSALRQGAIEQNTTQQNWLNDLQDLMDQYAQQRLDLAAQEPNLYASTLQQLMQSSFENLLATEQMNVNKRASKEEAAANQALIDYLTGVSAFDVRPHDGPGDSGPDRDGRNNGNNGDDTGRGTGPGRGHTQGGQGTTGGGGSGRNNGFPQLAKKIERGKVPEWMETAFRMQQLQPETHSYANQLEAGDINRLQFRKLKEFQKMLEELDAFVGPTGGGG